MPHTLATLDIPAVLEDLRGRDPGLDRLIGHIGPFALEPEYRQQPYGRLFRAIIYQQLAGAAAATIYHRVLAIRGGTGPPAPAMLLEIPDERLRGAGLSRNKLLALRDLAARTLDGTVPTLAQARRIPDEELVERLVAVRGIGRWTAEMLMMSGLGRPDVLPATDLGIQKGFQIVYRTRGLPTPKRILRQGRGWAPYRTIVSWYLWRAVDSPPPPPPPRVR